RALWRSTPMSRRMPVHGRAGRRCQLETLENRVVLDASLSGAEPGSDDPAFSDPPVAVLQANPDRFEVLLGTEEAELPLLLNDQYEAADPPKLSYPTHTAMGVAL